MENNQTEIGLFKLVLVYVSIFVCSLILFKEPFEFYIGYFAYLFLPLFMAKGRFNNLAKFSFAFLFLYGVIQIAMGNNEFGQFIKVYAGTFISYLFYHYFIEYMNKDVDKLFKYYLLGCYWVAIIGIIQVISLKIGFKYGYNFGWILNKWGVTFGGPLGMRVNSIFPESSYMTIFMSASFFVALYDFINLKNRYYYNRTQCVVLLILAFVSFSGSGYVGFFLIIILMLINYGFFKYFILFLPALYIVYTFLYNNVFEFRDRVDSTLILYSVGEIDLRTMNVSSIIHYNSYHIASENFKRNLLGTGLGSHPTAYEKYNLLGQFNVQGLDLNKQDANSMYNRLMSETGLFGLGLFLFIILKFYVIKKDNNNTDFSWLISNSILVMIILNLMRQGHYFLNGFPFFVWLYYFNYKNYHEKNN